jgi:hypothetical protein
MWDPQHLTILWDGFTFLYIGDVRTSQETHAWAFTARYWERFTFIFTLLSGDVREKDFTHMKLYTFQERINNKQTQS